MNKIDFDGKSEIININEDSIIYINNIDSFNLAIVLSDNIKCDLYYFNNKGTDSKISVNHSNNSIFNMYHSFESIDEYTFTYRSNMNGNNNINNINITGVSKNKVNLDVDGNVLKNTKNNELNENIKVLTVGGKAYVSPMIHVSCMDVIANHNTAISNIQEDELFYLNSKGIDREHAIKLVTDGYIYGVFKNNQEFIDLIK